jgi:hypothetical protein
MIQLKGAVLTFTEGRIGVIADDPHECPVCHRMTCFFTNDEGRTTCTDCAGEVAP